jgi:hypothetical protein
LSLTHDLPVGQPTVLQVAGAHCPAVQTPEQQSELRPQACAPAWQQTPFVHWPAVQAVPRHPSPSFEAHASLTQLPEQHSLLLEQVSVPSRQHLAAPPLAGAAQLPPQQRAPPGAVAHDCPTTRQLLLVAPRNTR